MIDPVEADLRRYYSEIERAEKITEEILEDYKDAIYDIIEQLKELENEINSRFSEYGLDGDEVVKEEIQEILSEYGY